MAKADWDLDKFTSTSAAAPVNPSKCADAIETASARALSFARMEAALSAFELSNFAAIMLNQFGCVLRMNQTAQRVLGSDVFICQRRLRSARQHETDALNRAIRRFLWDADPAMLPPFIITRAEGRPVLLYLLRSTVIGMEASSPCRGLILLVDPDRVLYLGRELFVGLFGLSPAESRLAATLLNGLNLEAAACELKVSYETARTTLKRIFQKTGTDRQAELIGLLTKISLPFLKSA